MLPVLHSYIFLHNYVDLNTPFLFTSLLWVKYFILSICALRTILTFKTMSNPFHLDYCHLFLFWIPFGQSFGSISSISVIYWLMALAFPTASFFFFQFLATLPLRPTLPLHLDRIFLILACHFIVQLIPLSGADLQTLYFVLDVWCFVSQRFNWWMFVWSWTKTKTLL